MTRLRARVATRRPTKMSQEDACAKEGSEETKRSRIRSRKREGREAVRWNAAISLRDRTKHSPLAIAEIEACTCRVRKGRAPLSLLRLSTLARLSLAPSRPLVTCSSCFVLALSICRSRSPSKLSRTFSSSVLSLTAQKFAPSFLHLHHAFTSSSASSSSLSSSSSSSSSLDTEFCFACFSSSPVRHTVLFLPLSVSLFFFSLFGYVYMHNAIFVHGPRKRRKSFYAYIVYAATAEVELPIT